MGDHKLGIDNTLYKDESRPLIIDSSLLIYFLSIVDVRCRINLDNHV